MPDRCVLSVDPFIWGLSVQERFKFRHWVRIFSFLSYYVPLANLDIGRRNLHFQRFRRIRIYQRRVNLAVKAAPKVLSVDLRGMNGSLLVSIKLEARSHPGFARIHGWPQALRAEYDLLLRPLSLHLRLIRDVSTRELYLRHNHCLWRLFQILHLLISVYVPRHHLHQLPRAATSVSTVHSCTLNRARLLWRGVTFQVNGLP